MFGKRAERYLIEAKSSLRAAAHPQDIEAAIDLARSAERLVRWDRRRQSLWADAQLTGARAEFLRGQIDIALGTAAVAIDELLNPGETAQDGGIAWQALMDLGQMYDALGDTQKAAELAMVASMRAGDRFPVEEHLSLLVSVTRAGWDAAAIEMASDFSHDSQVDPDFRTVARALLSAWHEPQLGVSDLSSLADAIADTNHPAVSDVSLQLANRLAAAGRADLALEISRYQWYSSLGVGGSWLRHARAAEVLASHLLATGYYGEAAKMAAESWVLRGSLRYTTGSPRLRYCIQASYELSRSTAMQCAVKMSDWRLLDELLCSVRLQSEPDVQGDWAELRYMRAAPTRRPRFRLPWQRLREVDPDSFSIGLREVFDDIFGPRLDLGTPWFLTVDGVSMLGDTAARLRGSYAHVQEPILRPADRSAHYDEDHVLWRSWVEDGTLFWSVRGRELEGGSLEHSRDPDICERLASLAVLKDPSLGGTLDPYDAMEEADSFVERDFTDPLTKLIPQPLLARMATRTCEAPLRIDVLLAPELDVVPWPILPLSTAGAFATRMIERAELCFIGSMRPRKRAPEDGDIPLPLLIDCDSYPHDRFGVGNRGATHTFRTTQTAGEAMLPAHGDNVLLALLELQPGQAGVGFFRGHFHTHPHNPASSGFELEDGILQAGFLYEVDVNTGEPVLRMPSRVFLSSCSSAANDRGGGESLSMVAGCLNSGASHVVASNVDVLHVSFTNVLDEMILETLQRAYDPVAGLRTLQLRFLKEWRIYSLRGISPSDDGDIRDPLPSIWAYFQVFVTESRY